MLSLQPSTYLQLPERFYQKLGPTLVVNPKILFWNSDLAADFGITGNELSVEDKALIFSGKKITQGTEPIALAYAGHQFGHFSPQLGDGRARLLGELKAANGSQHEVHLKGSGPTTFSRRGDGLATLDSTLREVIVSEGMKSLGIPTTRSLAVISTGEIVARERAFPGAILVRTAKSHVRIGTFEYFAARGDLTAIRRLVHFCIDQNQLVVDPTENNSVKLFEHVLRRQASLVSQWMSVGFIHGVMNTDNTTISGETIDYGPCAFMEAYNPLAAWSSIDHHGRYAYGRQPSVLQWNLGILGYCLLPLFSDEKKQAEEILKQKLSEFETLYQQAWLAKMSQKIGLKTVNAENQKWIEEYLALLHKFEVDFTLGFRHLGFQIQSQQVARSPLQSFTDTFFANPETKIWIERWRRRLQQEGRSAEEILFAMERTNPILIPRNHQVEKAIRAASDEKDFAPLERLLRSLKTPFLDDPNAVDLQTPAKQEEQVKETFCGT